MSEAHPIDVGVAPVDVGGVARPWTSDEAPFPAWREAIARGAIAEADALVIDRDDADAIAAVELGRRLRHEWSLDRDAMLARIRAEVPDVTDADLDAWTASGAIEGRTIDGEPRWFRREPRNLFLHDDAARRRRLAAGRPADRADRRAATASPIVPHLARAIATADASEQAARRVLPMRTQFLYVLTVRPNLRGATRGARVRAWLPFPRVHRQQKDVQLLATTPDEHRLAPPTSPQRSVLLEQKVIDPSRPMRFEMSVEYVTSAVVARATDRPAKYDVPTPADLAERRPHVAFTDEVRRIVDEQSRDSPDAITLAKRLWNWVDDHVPWCAEHEYGLIPSIVEHGLRNRRGDCGVQALIFISLCRCAGIPARWLSGWTTEPDTAGMHDWSEIWLDALGGWVTVDASYGKQRHDDPRVRDFYFGGVDAYRTIVNADFGRPLTPPIAGMRAEPLDFQRGEVELDGRVLYFDDWDYSFTFDHEPMREFGEEQVGDRRYRR